MTFTSRFYNSRAQGPFGKYELPTETLWRGAQKRLAHYSCIGL